MKMMRVGFVIMFAAFGALAQSSTDQPSATTTVKQLKPKETPVSKSKLVLPEDRKLSTEAWGAIARNHPDRTTLPDPITREVGLYVLSVGDRMK